MDNKTLLDIIKNLTTEQDLFFEVCVSNKINYDIKVAINKLVKAAKIETDSENFVSMISKLKSTLDNDNNQAMTLRGLTGYGLYETLGDIEYYNGRPCSDT